MDWKCDLPFGTADANPRDKRYQERKGSEHRIPEHELPGQLHVLYLWNWLWVDLYDSGHGIRLCIQHIPDRPKVRDED